MIYLSVSTTLVTRPKAPSYLLTFRLLTLYRYYLLPRQQQFSDVGTSSFPILYLLGMSSPCQCLLYCEILPQKTARFLLAASGPKLFSFDIATGELKSGWSFRPENSVVDIDERPSKRLKRAESQQSSGSSSAEIVVQELNGSKSKLKKYPMNKPNILKLVKTADNRHIIAVTGEDKCIRVYKFSDDGVLSHFSAR